MKTGPKNPYKQSLLGVIAKDHYADLILVNGDPTQGVSVLLDFDNNIPFVMKDGVVYKNKLN